MTLSIYAGRLLLPYLCVSMRLNKAQRFAAWRVSGGLQQLLQEPSWAGTILVTSVLEYL